MHCYLGNLITIAEQSTFVQTVRNLQSNTYVSGFGCSILSLPPAFLEKLYMSQSCSWAQTIRSSSRNESSTRCACSSPTLFWRQRPALPLATARSSRPASAHRLQMKGKWERRGRKEKKTPPRTHTHSTTTTTKKITLLQTRWEHSTWPNQSITSVGRRCNTAV